MVSNNRKRNDAVFRAISDPTRREILAILRSGHRTVGDIAGNFRMSRPAVSKHLRLLHSAGLVATRKEGTANICRLQAGPLQMVEDWVGDYAVFWNESLRGLKRFIEEEK